MFDSARLRLRAAALAMLTTMTGCASEAIVNHTSRPGKFRLYDCALLDKRGGELVRRERELNDLMTKARQGPGGEVAIALAYQNEYNLVVSDLREVDAAGAERKCVFKLRHADSAAAQ